MKAASVASTLVTKALFDLTKVQVELENLDKKLWALSDTQREQEEACGETRVLKSDQHGIAKKDATVMGRLLANFKDCPGVAFLECEDGVALPENAQKLAGQLSKNASTALLQLGVRQEPAGSEAPRKCVLPTVARCDSIADGMAQLYSLMKDREGTLAVERAGVEEQCRGLDEKIGGQQTALRNARGILVDRQQFAMRAKTLAETAAARKQEEYVHLQEIIEGWRSDCSVTLRDMQFKVEKLERTRAAKEGLVQDCEVSAWQPGPCSAECGTGTRQLTRNVISPAGPAGNPCPNLTRSEECNRHPCPVDCELGNWSPWAECSRTCGGGTQSRDRVVVKAPKGGTPCGAQTETQICHMEACDVDCALSEWSVWGPCSQRCGTDGAQKREKTVTAPAVGEGKCFEWDDILRREFQACAVVPCAEAPAAAAAATAVPATPTDPNLGFHMCDGASMDLILLLDASGSVSEDELAAEKDLLMGLLEHMEVSASTTQVAVAAYAANAVRVAEFGAGFEDIQRAVTGFGRLPPAGSDFAMALGAATRMMEERTLDEERPTTIVLFADGRDNAQRRANIASRELRSQGVRIVAVAAGRPENVAEVASRPGYANVISAPTFAEVDPVAVARKVCPSRVQALPVPAASAAAA
jgi:hypothetical protein